MRIQSLFFFAKLFAKLPTSSFLVLGRWLGWFLRKVAKKRVCLVAQNLAMVFPEQSPETREALLKQHFTQVAIGLCEIVNIWFAQDNSPLALIEQAEVTGLDIWQTANQSGHGVILCVHHHTYMESMGVLLGKLGEVYPVYRPQDNVELEAVSAQARTRWTAGAVSNRDVRQMIRLLKQQKTLWLAPDLRHRKEGIEIDFMGNPQKMHPSIARIARLTSAKIIPVTCHRNADHRLSLAFHPAIEQVEEKSDEVVLTEITQLIIQEIQNYPEQYFWLHDRFDIGDRLC